MKVRPHASVRSPAWHDKLPADWQEFVQGPAAFSNASGTTPGYRDTDARLGGWTLSSLHSGRSQCTEARARRGLYERSMLETPVRVLTAAAVLAVALSAGCGRKGPQGPVQPPRVLPGEQAGAATTAKGTGASVRGPEATSADKLIIFHAASLARPFGDLEELFEKRHPGVDVVRESGASVSEARKITDLGRKCDVYAAADYTVLDDMLIPDHASYNILFLRERIVIAYTQRSKYAAEITSDNWHNILLRPDVKVGYANPLQAPVGWRTLIVWKLADDYYADKLGGKSLYEALLKKIPEKHVVPDVGALQPLLESLELDYAFMYKATAMQHNVQWVKLPDEIDLGNEKFADRYAKPQIELKDKLGRVKRRRGSPCVYGITILNDAPHPDLALEWLELLFGPEGQEILKRDFLEAISPPKCVQWNTLPAALQDLVEHFAG